MRAATGTASFTGVYPGAAEQLGRARREVARYLEGCPRTGDAVLVVSRELVTNAVLYSQQAWHADCPRGRSSQRADGRGKRRWPRRDNRADRTIAALPQAKRVQ